MAGGGRVAVIGRGQAEALDAADPLAGFRDRFVTADGGRIYLDGNSLGRLGVDARAGLTSAIDDWGTRLVGGWHDWIDLPTRAGDELAPLVGAGAGEVLVCDSVTVNLYKLADAVLTQRPGAVVFAGSDFPTDRYVLAGLAARHGRAAIDAGTDPPPVLRGCGEVALVALSHVDYRSGALADMPAITAAAHDAGGMMLWDLSHSVGAVAVELGRCGADLAVGCTYKYLNAGPGAPGFLYVNSRHQPTLRSPIQGWFGQRDQFAMGAEYKPAEGIGRFLAGTPSVLGIEAVRSGAGLVAEAGIAALRDKSLGLTDLAVDLHDERLAPLGFELATPRDPHRRGSHVSLSHPDGWRICRALIERADVVPDFREPDIVRLGMAPLYTRFTDVWDAIERLVRLIDAGEHLAYDPTPTRVT
jgi:kynureninase